MTIHSRIEAYFYVQSLRDRYPDFGVLLYVEIKDISFRFPNFGVSLSVNLENISFQFPNENSFPEKYFFFIIKEVHSFCLLCDVDKASDELTNDFELMVENLVDYASQKYLYINPNIVAEIVSVCASVLLRDKVGLFTALCRKMMDRTPREYTGIPNSSINRTNDLLSHIHSFLNKNIE